MFEYACKFVRCIDGDTVVLDIDLGLRTTRREIVRLLGINCPEPRQPGGSEAAMFVVDWFAVQDPSALRIHTHKDRQEKYGRWLGVIRGRQTCLNDALIEAGHAVR